MSRVDELPADQRATLSLLLRQRKSYAQVAGMLAIDERAVHDRAHAALAVLAPREARELDAERRDELGDFVLGQQAVAERLRTRTLLASSPPANAWARALAGELATLGEGALPEIPELSPAVEPGGDSEALAPEQDAPVEPAAARGPRFTSEPAGGPRAGAASSIRPSSRRGGAVLLGVLAVAVIVAVVVILSDGSSGKGKSSASTATGTTASSTSASSSPKEVGHFALHANAGSTSTGAVEILSAGGQRAFYIAAEHLPSTNHFFYAIWLYNSPTSALALSKAPAVGNNHKLAGAALLPSNAGHYHELLLTRETNTRPKQPGPVVLRGTFKLTG